MSTERIYEQWRQHHRNEGLLKGREETLRRSLRTVYESRFGPMPPALVAALDATADLSRLESWLPKVAIGSAEEIDAELTRGAGG